MARSRSIRRRLERVLGPAGSLLVHLLVFALVLTLFRTAPPEEPRLFEVTYVRQPDPLPPAPPPLDHEPPPMPAEPMPAERPAPVPSADELLGELAEELVPTEMAPPTFAPAPLHAPLQIHLAQSQRAAPGRALALRTYGDPRYGDTEGAVLRALAWLRANQQADGSWGPRPAAMTGLALLTFLAHGETPGSAPFGGCVERAIRFLLNGQQPDGRFADTGAQHGAYEQAIATYAICEAFALTRIPALRPAMDRAVGVLLAGQGAGGSWTYRYARDGRRDTSLAGWHIQALKAAKAAGSGVAGLNPALRRAVADLREAHDARTGRFWYSRPVGPSSPGTTAAAVLCLQLAGEGRSREVKSGLRALRAFDCNWTEPPPWAFYTWYYQTQALFQAGGPSWTRWNRVMARTLTNHQNADGSWTAPAPAGNGVGRELSHGPVYSTTLAALTLEVYYRLLPSYASEARSRPVEQEPVVEEALVEVI